MTKKKPKSEHKRSGQPTKYKKSFDKMAYIACAEGGFTDLKLARLFGIAKATLNNWKRSHPKFLASIQKGKDEYDLATAENSLKKRVNGYNYKEVTKKRVVVRDENNYVVLDENGKPKTELQITKTISRHIPGDPRSIMFFLKNRNPERWPDRFDVEVGGDITVVVNKFSEEKKEG